jgi:isoleucyl-tRNA synthetase
MMHEIFRALCRLLAPVLVFTAEESWRHSALGGSVHLQEFPQAEDQHGRARPVRTGLASGAPSNQVAELLRLRGVIGQAIEKARQDKLIGNALEAAVVLHSDSDVTAKISKEELEEFFILSDLTIRQADEATASVTKTAYKKCARCWRHRPAVGTSKQHPDLCDRCESVVEALSAKPR